LIFHGNMLFISEHDCSFASMLCGLLPEFPSAHGKESWTILKFASLQIQNSPSGLKQLDLRPFRFTKNGGPQFFNVPPGNPGSDRFRNAILLALDGFPTSPADFVHGQPCSPKVGKLRIALSIDFMAREVVILEAV
jgi:hypothetical protein